MTKHLKNSHLSFRKPSKTGYQPYTKTRQREDFKTKENRPATPHGPELTQVNWASGRSLGGQLQIVGHEGGQRGLYPVSGRQGLGEPPWKATRPTLCHLALLGETGAVPSARLSGGQLEACAWSRRSKTLCATTKTRRSQIKTTQPDMNRGLPWWLSGKNPLAMQETRVQPRGQEDPLEKEMATRSSIPAWAIPWTEKPGGLQFMGLQSLKQRKLTSWQASIPTETQTILINQRAHSFKSRAEAESTEGWAGVKRQWPWQPDLFTCRTCESWPQTVTLSQITELFHGDWK